MPFDEIEYFTLPNGEKVTFSSKDHKYTVRGVVVPSVTTVLKYLYGDAYAAVKADVLERASAYGTMVHEELQKLIEIRRDAFLDVLPLCTVQETINYFTKVEPIYKIEPVSLEKVIVLYDDAGVPVAAGRFDLLCKVKGELTLADFKTTSTIHRQLVTGQLNMYLKAAYQCGYITSEDLKLGVIHLSGEKARYIPIDRMGQGFFNKVYEKLKENKEAIEQEDE